MLLQENQFGHLWLSPATFGLGRHGVPESLWERRQQQGEQRQQEREQEQPRHRHIGRKEIISGKEDFKHQVLRSVCTMLRVHLDYVTQPCNIGHITIWSLFKNGLGPLKTKTPPNRSHHPWTPLLILSWVYPNPLFKSDETVMCLISYSLVT